MNLDWNSIKEQAANLSLYDVKAGIRKVQASVMNYSEYEVKVREATNNEPWGTSQLVYGDLSLSSCRGIVYIDAGHCQWHVQLVCSFNKGRQSATDNGSQHLNEIMPMIYKRCE